MKKFIGLYTFFLILLSIFSFLFVDPNFFYLRNIYTGFFTSYRLETTILYILFLILFFVFYGYILRKVQEKILRIESLLLLVAISVTLLIFSYPSMLSFDLFNYIATAKVAFFYGENPYIVMPIEFPVDSMLLFTHAANKLALYGPFWVLLTAIPYFFGFGSYLLTILSFKLFLLFFYLGTVFLIWKLSHNLLSVAFFALSPLVLIETFVSGHNDIVMVFLMMNAFLFLLKKRIFLSILFLILSIFIKYATLLLIPVFLYAIWKTQIKKEKVDKELLFALSGTFMFVAFLLSPLREEIYPWYSIWFLPFVALLPSKKSLLYFSIVFSFFLLLRYTPFMWQGFHYGSTPAIKTALTFIPLGIFIVYELFLKRVLSKKT